MKSPLKQNRQTKTCAVCNRPFQWRKKWEKCWEEIRYCSDRCRQNRQSVKENKP
ncbi:MAG: DUF2256 domain-containing protein [Chitinophagaceae bacterium]|nr:DUF2256 domain-containing protein [Chitinophagaceae bacterium]